MEMELEERIIAIAGEKATSRLQNPPLTKDELTQIILHYRTGNAEQRKKVIQALFTYSRVENAINYWIGHFYGYWGCLELEPMYANDADNTLKEKIEMAAFEGICHTLLTIPLPIANTKNSCVEYLLKCSTPWVKHYIQLLLVEEANTFFRLNLTEYYYTQLVKMKKAGFTGYILQYSDEELAEAGFSRKTINVLKNAWYPIYGEQLGAPAPILYYEDDYRVLHKDQGVAFAITEKVIANWTDPAEREFFHDWAIEEFAINPNNEAEKKLYSRQKRALKKALTAEQEQLLKPINDCLYAKSEHSPLIKHNKLYTALHWLENNYTNYSSKSDRIKACVKECGVSEGTAYKAYKMFPSVK